MYFDEVKKNFGFGCMRLPMIENGKAVDIEQTKKMVDTFIEQGFNYFDTAHGYLEGKSELALKECLTSRYKREEYILTDKLTMTYFNKQEDIRPFFESQLEACGVEYFDFYLMHSQSKDTFEHFKKCRAYETALELKKEGKIHHFGISFHDKAEVLEEILREYPQIEVVQIQFNYLDYEDSAVQSRKCYEVCRRYNKPVIVMEPVKGGNLVNLPDDAPYPETLLNQLTEMGAVVHMKLAKTSNLIGEKKFVERLGIYTVLTTSINYATTKQLFMKRALDILGGLVGCLITLILTVILGPLIYIQSPGPIFFSQVRVGKNGKKFKIYKFRSMYMDAEERKKELMKQNRVKDGMMFKLEWDPRIIGTKKLPDGTIKKGIGNIIRDFSLDEFPQFFNVLKGVGGIIEPTEKKLDFTGFSLA